ncbi:MAG: C-type lectin domain-containing protein [Planctomycetota bacterium]|nr:C-type lectin domain-containing protein [Planctomycetota bacterium]
MRPLALLVTFLALAVPSLAQTTKAPVHEVHRPDAFTTHVRSGDGIPGGPDAAVTYLAGPIGGWTSALTAADFAAARGGPQAMVLDSWAWTNKSLTTHPLSQWIAPTLAWSNPGGAASALLAIDFDVPVPVFSASMDFHFTADDNLGAGSVAGLFLNELPVHGSNIQNAWGAQYDFPMRNVGPQLHQGTNTLYIHLVNTGGAGGLLFDAIVRVNPVPPDECGTAREVFLDDNHASTKALTTSTTPSTCGMQNDAWHYFVPKASGNLTVTLSAGGGGALVPALAVYDGSCAALNELSCGVAPGVGGQLTWTGPVVAGAPLLLRVGGGTAATGRYGLRLDLASPATGSVNPVNGHFYKLSPTQMTMPAARAWAQSQGGYLVAINDAAENAWVAAQLPAGSIWLGASDELAEGTWLWDSGEAFVYSNWAAGEPNDNPACGGEDFVQFDSFGGWRDYPSGVTPCGNTVRFALVEIPASGQAAVTDLGGACGPNPITPGLASEPHKLGTTAVVGIFDAGPGEPIILIKSPPPAAPLPLGTCLIQIDQATAVLVAAFAANEYGSGTVSVPIPSDPLLIGLVEVWQAQLFAGVSIASYSNGLEIQLGN